MPSHIPRSLEPYSKLELLEKREQQLRIAIAKSASVSAIGRAAEHVRKAQLAVLKARRELIRYESPTDDVAKQLSKLSEMEVAWQGKSVREIVSVYDGAA